MLKGQKKHIDKDQDKTKHEELRSVNYRATQNKNNIGNPWLTEHLPFVKLWDRKSSTWRFTTLFCVFRIFLHGYVVLPDWTSLSLMIFQLYCHWKFSSLSSRGFSQPLFRFLKANSDTIWLDNSGLMLVLIHFIKEWICQLLHLLVKRMHRFRLPAKNDPAPS